MDEQWGNIFSSGVELVEALDQHDRLLLDCSEERISFEEFLERYNDFYAYYALDGHESDDEERELLEKHNKRIRPHEEMTFEILGKLCADEDAVNQSYIDAGRFGSDEALRRTKLLVRRYFKVSN